MGKTDGMVDPSWRLSLAERHISSRISCWASAFWAGGFQRACPPAGYIKHHQTNYSGWHQDGCITALRSKVLWLRLHWLLFVWRSQAAAKQVQGKDLTWIKTDLPLMPWMPERNKGISSHWDTCHHSMNRRVEIVKSRIWNSKIWMLWRTREAETLDRLTIKHVVLGTKVLL